MPGPNSGELMSILMWNILSSSKSEMMMKVKHDEPNCKEIAKRINRPNKGRGAPDGRKKKKEAR
jgi:hypothetical protein